MDFQQALKNPGKMFGGAPEAVESSAEFDAGQKRATLAAMDAVLGGRVSSIR